MNDKRLDAETGEGKRFSSAILPPWCRKSPKISGVLPLLYLHGLSSGDFGPANAPHLVALVRAGARAGRGRLAGRPGGHAA